MDVRGPPASVLTERGPAAGAHGPVSRTRLAAGWIRGQQRSCSGTGQWAALRANHLSQMFAPPYKTRRVHGRAGRAAQQPMGRCGLAGGVLSWRAEAGVMPRAHDRCGWGPTHLGTSEPRAGMQPAARMRRAAAAAVGRWVDTSGCRRRRPHHAMMARSAGCPEPLGRLPPWMLASIRATAEGRCSRTPGFLQYTPPSPAPAREGGERGGARVGREGRQAPEGGRGARQALGENARGGGNHAGGPAGGCGAGVAPAPPPAASSACQLRQQAQRAPGRARAPPSAPPPPRRGHPGCRCAGAAPRRRSGSGYRLQAVERQRAGAGQWEAGRQGGRGG